MNETSAPYWVLFPARAIPVDWSSPSNAHGAVMRLFPWCASEVARSEMGVLYRYEDRTGEEALVHIQSRIEPSSLPDGAKIMRLPEAAWSIPDGSPISLRLAYSPIVRHGSVERALVGDSADDLACEKLVDAGLEGIEILDSREQTTGRRQGNRKGGFVVIRTIDAIANVADSEKFKLARLNGIGRKKSYGAGLLTAMPIGNE